MIKKYKTEVKYSAANLSPRSAYSRDFVTLVGAKAFAEWFISVPSTWKTDYENNIWTCEPDTSQNGNLAANHLVVVREEELWDSFEEFLRWFQRGS